MSRHEEPTLVVDRLADDLRERITSGKYGNAGAIPSSSMLATEWKTTRSIVTQVMLQLRSEGLIRMVKKRYVVNWPRLILAGMTRNFEDYLRDQGMEPVVDNVVDPELVPMPAAIATLFGQPAGVHVVHRVRRQGAAGQPLRIAENWYPAPLAGGFLAEMQNDQFMDVLEAIKRVHGIAVEQVKEEILARVPTAQEVLWLEIARYQPVFEVRRVNLSQDGVPIMFNRIIMVATSFLLNREYNVNYWK